jgi:NitT/TauT family transport system permease protein
VIAAASAPTGARLAVSSAGLAALLAAAFMALRYVHQAGVAGNAPLAFWLGILALSGLAWAAVEGLSRVKGLRPLGDRALALAIPIIFGAVVLFLWEVITVGAGVPQVLMPSPSAIAHRLAVSNATLGEDFVQTVLRAVIPGWLIGCVLGFIVAILCDRVPFLRRGLLPIGNFVAALPMIGIAPIMVMWFGFDWQSKAAVVAIMTFFPMLVNTIAGLAAPDHLERDVMRSYGADPWQTLIKLKLPSAMPFIFNALKINSTLAMIGAIVAEFFGTPIVGMGFRISTEVGRSSLDMVWAEIVVAAVSGSLFYGLIALVERAVTFWHPSYRGR